MPRWTPPLSEHDLTAVLDDLPPAAEDAAGIAERLRGHLARLVTIAVAAEEDRRDAITAQLIEQARALSTESILGDCWPATGHLRRMGWTASELLDRLVSTRCLREVA
ncbi:DUF6415 family natural product biosynthesis protein [Streptomyces hirsutus]|uniref:DUF6415 family natural product biosynthesis protein n=1 Tax=Streptomyces hirsutus TaxID=35620 RepID=UPI00365C1026